MAEITLEAFMSLLSVRLHKNFTDEQLELAKDFTQSKICFADPGTGKTTTSVAGLLTAELFHKIPGQNIYALSFTKMATSELEVRHRLACKELNIKQTVNFQTLHSLCTTILKENYRLLGMESLNSTGSIPIEDCAKLLQDTASEEGIKLNPYKVRPLVHAIRSLNNSLIFDQENVESKMVFKEVGISFEDFTKLRKTLYIYNKLIENIPVDDILLYTLELLTRFPEVSKAFKEKCKVMLVDEAQDLSLLQLRLISLMTDHAVLIGDIKQQIYAFNGACQEVVEQFFKFYPDAGSLKLSQSFRCKNEIADYATSLILPNRMGGEDYKGVGPGGLVSKEPDIDLPMLCDDLAKVFHENNNTFPDSILFLFRNNYSSIPIAEELYKRRLPFRVNKYKGANEIPVIRELCEIVELCRNPMTYSNVKALAYLIPEFRGYRSSTDNPLAKIASMQGVSLFDVEYSFKNDYIGNRAMEILLEICDDLHHATPLGKIFNKLWPLFYENYLRDKEPYLEYKAEYYTSLVAPLVKEKTYSKFIQDEAQKLAFIKDNEEHRKGIRCYTCHAAKGLEADIVHFLDADEGVIPNASKLHQMDKKGCSLEIAREVRNERSLVYVSVTRAKKEFHLHYNEKNGLSSLFTTNNEYSEYDKLYQVLNTVYDDVESFTEFYS